jgi:hypothetical protein
MNVVSGPVTFGSTGPKTVALGISAIEIEFFPDNSGTYGHANSGFQFSRTPGINNDHTKISIFDESTGVKVVEFTHTNFSGTNWNCNVTLANAAYPIVLVARTA